MWQNSPGSPQILPIRSLRGTLLVCLRFSSAYSHILHSRLTQSVSVYPIALSLIPSKALPISPITAATLSPGFQVLSPPLSTTSPTASIPRTRGNLTEGECPCRVNNSERLSPAARIRINTLPGCGWGFEWLVVYRRPEHECISNVKAQIFWEQLGTWWRNWRFGTNYRSHSWSHSSRWNVRGTKDFLEMQFQSQMMRGWGRRGFRYADPFRN